MSFPLVSFGEKGDVPAVKELLSRNLYQNIPAELRSVRGFLRYDVEPEVFERCARDGNLHIARLNDKLVGYMMLFDCQQARENPFFSEFMQNAEGMSYDGKLIRDSKAIVYAQVCIDRDFRGQGVLELLHKGVKDHNKTRFDIGISEIDAQNAISWNVHTKRFGVKHIGSYTANNGADWRVIVMDFKDKFPYEVMK